MGEIHSTHSEAWAHACTHMLLAVCESVAKTTSAGLLWAGIWLVNPKSPSCTKGSSCLLLLLRRRTDKLCSTRPARGCCCWRLGAQRAAAMLPPCCGLPATPPLLLAGVCMCCLQRLRRDGFFSFCEDYYHICGAGWRSAARSPAPRPRRSSRASKRGAASYRGPLLHAAA